MRNWRIVTVTPLGGGRYRVYYIVGKDEKHTVTVEDTFGLDTALTAMGVHLASLHPRQYDKISSRKPG